VSSRAWRPAYCGDVLNHTLADIFGVALAGSQLFAEADLRIATVTTSRCPVAHNRAFRPSAALFE
jgi:hypothetical protein